MRLATLLLVIGLSLNLHGQYRKDHHIGVSLSPAVTGISITSESFPNIIDWENFIGGSIGLSALWNISPRLTLQTDLIYSLYTEINKFETNFGNIDPTLGFILPSDNPHTITLINEYHKVSVPFLLNYYFNDSKWSWFAQAGLRGHISIVQYSSVIPDKELNLERSRNRMFDKDENLINRFLLSGQVGFGVEYNPSRKFKLRISPYFEHFLTNMINTENDIRWLPYGAGLTFGAYWRI
jgi:hypothetical protein